MLHQRRVTDPGTALPPPMTEEQLAFFTEQTERAAQKASAHAVREWRNRAVAGFVFLILGIGFVQHDSARRAADGQRTASANAQAARDAIVQSGRVVSVAGCNRDFRTQTAVRGVLTASMEFARTAARRGTITPTDLQQRVKFYALQLDNLALPDCRDARDIVTADPSNTDPIPTPLHPPDPKPLHRPQLKGG